jgi:hypothetical protein
VVVNLITRERSVFVVRREGEFADASALSVLRETPGVVVDTIQSAASTRVAGTLDQVQKGLDIGKSIGNEVGGLINSLFKS